jgi:hypothetical protein
MPDTAHCIFIVAANTPPTTTVPVISPPAPDTAEDLYCDATLTDAEQTNLIAYWTWYQNGTPYLSGSTNVSNNTATNVTVLGNGNTTKGETWNCSVTPNDGLLNGTTQTSAGVVILNTLPTTPNISLSPANPNTTSDLVCTASGGTDLDLDSVTYFYEWYNGTTLMFTTGNQSGPSTLDNGNTTKDDVWNCTAIPFDGEGNGTANSTTVTILNSAPIISSLSIAAPIIKGGMQQQVDAVGQGDDDSDTLDFYCCDTSDTCTPDTLADTKASPYGGMNWTYNAPLLGFANVTVRCLVSDGTANSSIVSANYTEDDSIPFYILL